MLTFCKSCVQLEKDEKFQLKLQYNINNSTASFPVLSSNMTDYRNRRIIIEFSTKYPKKFRSRRIPVKYQITERIQQKNPKIVVGLPIE